MAALSSSGPASRVFATWWGRVWALLALLNLSLGARTFRYDDFEQMYGWLSAWLHDGINLYGAFTRWGTDYPPNGIVVLSPIALLPMHASAVVWMFLSIGLALVLPALAARNVDSGASKDDVTLLTLTFLCWSGTRTVLQFSLLPLFLAMCAWRLADRKPWVAGALLGAAILKPQVALPVCLWVLLTGRWRLVIGSATTVGALWAVYCLRAGAGPLSVLSGLIAALQAIYTDAGRLKGFSELNVLLTGPQADTWGMVITVALFASVLVAAVRVRRVNPTGDLTVVPAAAAAATLLAFHHLSLAFVTMLPAAAYLLLDGDAETRARRRPLFWVLQAGMIVDLPTIQRRLEFINVSLGGLDVVMRHADRALILGCLVVLVALQWSRRHGGVMRRLSASDGEPA